MNEGIMEKICIVKLRKDMTKLPGLGEEHGHGKDTGANALPEGIPPHPTPMRVFAEERDRGESGVSKGDEAGRVVALALTREQTRDLRSNPFVAPLLDGQPAAECGAVRSKDGSVVVRFEFASMPPVRLLKVEEVIRMLRVSKTYLNRAIREGHLKSYKFGRLRRFMLDDVLSYLEDHREAADVRQQASQLRRGGKEVL